MLEGIIKYNFKGVNLIFSLRPLRSVSSVLNEASALLPQRAGGTESRKVLSGSSKHPPSRRVNFPGVFDAEEVGEVAVIITIVNHKVGNLSGFQ